MNKGTKKKYIVWMAAGIILNMGLYYVAHVFKLPVWMDSIGTAVTAVALEPAAGLLVAFATNFYQAAVVYDSSSLVYYMVSACAALIFGVGLRKQGRLTMKRLPGMIVLYAVAATILAALITLWRTAGVPDSGWERFFYEEALANGIPNVLACLWGTFVLKIADSIIIAAAILGVTKLLPESWMNK